MRRLARNSYEELLNLNRLLLHFVLDHAFVKKRAVFSGPDVPVTILVNIENDGTWLSDAENIDELRLNTDLETSISEVKWPRREFGTFQSDKYPEKRLY